MSRPPPAAVCRRLLGPLLNVVLTTGGPKGASGGVHCHVAGWVRFTGSRVEVDAAVGIAAEVADDSVQGFWVVFAL